MKIICIGRNYAEHVRELKHTMPSEPVIFMKPDTALLLNGKPFFLPDFSNDIQHEVEIVLKVCKAGKNIAEQYAHKYYDEIGLGIDFTARDLQNKLKDKGLPWELSKAFDGAAAVGDFLPASSFGDTRNISFRLDVNGHTRQKGNTRDLTFSFDYFISYVSRFILLRKGDLLFTGTPEGVARVAVGDKLEGYIGDKKLLSFFVK